MNKKISLLAFATLFAFAAKKGVYADTTDITAGLNAPVIGATGGSRVFWGPIVSQTSMEFKGNTDAYHPVKYAGTFIQGSGGPASGFHGCLNPGDATHGPNSSAPYAWYCNYPVPPAPEVNFDDYKYLAQQQGNSCNGQPCYNADPNPSLTPNDTTCLVNGQPKVWFFEGNPTFSSGYFCGVLVSRGAVKFTGGGAGSITVTPPSDAWTQYLVATPATNLPDTANPNEYPADNSLHQTMTSYPLSGVSFHGYIFASTGYTAVGNTIVVGAVQFGQGAASTSGGGTIYFQPQIIFSPPPPGRVNQPIITPPGGNFTGPVPVSIADTTPGSIIVYTLDGSDPANSQTAITATNPANLTISQDTKLIAIGRDPTGALLDSIPATANFTFGSGPAPTQIQFSASNYSVSRAALSAVITVTRSGSDLSGTSTVQYATTSGGTATEGQDYASVSGTLTFNPNETSKTFSVPIFNDGIKDGPETVYLMLSQPTPAGVVLGLDKAILTINDPISAPTSEIQFDPTTYTVDEGAGHADITVTRTVEASGTSTVQYLTTTGGTATAGVDYVSVSGTLTFNPGETSKIFEVPIINDRITETNGETVNLALQNPSNAVLTTANAVLTIVDQNPPPAPSPAPFISELIPYSAPVDQTASMTVRILGADFDATGAEVYWNTTLPLTVLSRTSSEIDVKLDPSAWNNQPGIYPMFVRNHNPSLADSNTANFTVQPVGSGNPAPSLTSLSPNSAAAGSPAFTLTVQGANFRSGAVVLWNGAARTTNFGGATLLTASIPATDVANAGTANVRVQNPDQQMSNSLPFTITPPPSVHFDANSYTVAEDAGVKQVTVVREGANLNGTSHVDFATSGGSAVPGVNFVLVTGTLTFDPGITSQTFDVPIINDGIASGDKTVLLTLLNAKGAAIVNPSQATLTIQDVGAPATPPPAAPYIQALVPYSAPVDYSQSFTIRVLGEGFDANASQVLWNRTTSLTVISRSTQEIDVTMVPGLWNNTPGTYPIIVRNPGGVDSNDALFTVRPTLSGNPPPYVAAEPSADPNPTTLNYTYLNVKGGSINCPSDGSCLTYTWKLVGTNPSPNVTFDSAANGSLAGSHTKVTFPAQIANQAVYHFVATITDTKTSFSVQTRILDVTVIRTPVSLTLNPKTKTITPDQTVDFTVTVPDQFGANFDNPDLLWTKSAGSLALGSSSAILSVDTGAQTIHITASLKNSSLSDDADVTVIYGSGGVGSISEAVPSPVPYKSTSGLPGVTFRRLVPGTTIRLFSTDGHLVRTLHSEDGADKTWTLENDDGNRVSSGVYFFIIEGAGQKKEGKVVLIL